VGSSDRITLPGDLGSYARQSERQFQATGSDVRTLIPLRAVPWLVVTYDQLQTMPLYSQDAFVVSLVDGRMNVEALLDISGLQEDETLDILRKLLLLGAIELHDA
jgi:hypothetical protein